MTRSLAQMPAPLNTVVLIDDDRATNFLHELVLTDGNYAREVVAFQKAGDALTYLSEPRDGVLPQPDLILLDLNMPAMDGWEFLAAYARLPQASNEQTVVVMLTTSINPDHAAMARTFPALDAFQNKPLTAEMMQSLLHEHFSHRV